MYSRKSIRSLHDTITRLGMIHANNLVLAPSVEGRLTKFDDFGSNPGALGAKIYIPDRFSSGAPLVVVLHGCTQNAESYDHGAGWSKAADEQGFALLFPEQKRTNNPNLCFNWYSDEDARRGQGEAHSISQMVEAMIGRYGCDPTRVFVTGLSAGGAMTAVMLATYPELFAGGGIIAGLAYGTAHSVPQAFDRMRGHGGPTGKALSQLVQSASGHRGPWPRLSIWHGSGDMTVVPGNAQDLIDQWSVLHGVSQAPSRTDEVLGYPHRIWCDSDGREVIEEYSITGMAHGTPLDASTGETGEIAGAHMLEAGISSTRLLLRFWGVAPATRKAKAAVRHPASSKGGRKPARAARERRPSDQRGHIGKIIERALRSAGLLR